MSKENRKRRRELGLLPEPEQCVARSKRSGARCKNPPLAGSVVCRMHGGSAPQVLRKSQERIVMAQDDAATLLTRWMQDPAVPFAERRKCAEALLNRGGNAPGQRLQIGIDAPPWLAIIDGIVSETDDHELPRYSAIISEGLPDEADIVDAELVMNEDHDEPPEPLPALVPTSAPQPRIPSRRGRGNALGRR